MSTSGSSTWYVRWAPFAVCLPLVWASGCRERSTKPNQRSEAVAAPATSAPSLYARGGLSPLLAALREKAGADPSFLRLELAEQQATVQVEAQGGLGQLVQYQWRGGALSAGTAVELRGKGNLSQNLFPLSALDLTNLPAVLEAAVAKVDPEDGKVSRVLIRRNLPQDDSVGMRVYVESPRRSSHVDTDARGKLLDPGKYP